MNSQTNTARGTVNNAVNTSTATATTAGSAKKSPPAFALYAIEKQPMSKVDREKAERQGRKVAENATQSIWTKVGVAFAMSAPSRGEVAVDDASSKAERSTTSRSAVCALDQRRSTLSRAGETRSPRRALST